MQIFDGEVATLSLALLPAACSDDAKPGPVQPPVDAAADGPAPDAMKSPEDVKPPSPDVPPDMRTDAPPDVLADVPADGVGDGGDGGLSCPGPHRTVAYLTPGCGLQAPAPICGYAMDACLSGYVCTCDGKVEATCERWSSQPWAYYVRTLLVPYGNPCDPNHPPDDGGSLDAPGDSAADALSCGAGRVPVYPTAGCGPQAPAPVCASPLDSACLIGSICTCAGKFQLACASAAAVPWAYLSTDAKPEGTPCDPAHPPTDGGP